MSGSQMVFDEERAKGVLFLYHGEAFRPRRQYALQLLDLPRRLVWLSGSWADR